MTALGQAQAYDRHTGRYGPELAPAFIEFAAIAPAMRVLEIGCGPGALTAELATVVGGRNLAAVDPSEAYAAVCRERVPGADVRVGAAEALPFEADAFDAVLSQLVVQSLEDVEIGELSAGAHYNDFDDAWYSFAAGVSASGAYCRSLDEDRRTALREEFRRRLGRADGPFRLAARAWAVRGRAPASHG